MASHTRPYGEPRTVDGYEVSFTITEFSRSVGRSLDVYATDNGEEVLLTEESVDEMPSDEEISTLLDWACEEGQLACKWRVDYSIWTGIDGTRVADGSAVVMAHNESEAEALGFAWVADNDPHDDPRIDPSIEITNTTRLTVGD